MLGIHIIHLVCRCSFFKLGLFFYFNTKDSYTEYVYKQFNDDIFFNFQYAVAIFFLCTYFMYACISFVYRRLNSVMLFTFIPFENLKKKYKILVFILYDRTYKRYIWNFKNLATIYVCMHIFKNIFPLLKTFFIGC